MDSLSPDSTVPDQIEKKMPEELLTEQFGKIAKPITASIGPLDETFDESKLVEILTSHTVEKDVSTPMDTDHYDGGNPFPDGLDDDRGNSVLGMGPYLALLVYLDRPSVITGKVAQVQVA